MCMCLSYKCECLFIYMISSCMCVPVTVCLLEFVCVFLYVCHLTACVGMSLFVWTCLCSCGYLLVCVGISLYMCACVMETGEYASSQSVALGTIILS